MKRSSLMSSFSKVLISAIIISPLQGCLLNGNVRMDGASIGDSLGGMIGSGSAFSGKKEWPFIPTPSEKRMAEYSDGVIVQAQTGRSVRAAYPQDQKAFAASRLASFKSFMASAPQMSQWTGAQAVEYTDYLRDLIPVADAIIAADEGKGAGSDAAFKKYVAANRGVIKTNTVTVPAHTAMMVALEAYCADRHFLPPSKNLAMSLVPASFAQAVPNELADHLRNTLNAHANGSPNMQYRDFSEVLWAMTEAGNFTQKNRQIFQPANESLMNRFSPGLYADFNAYNQKTAIANGQNPNSAYPLDRDSIVDSKKVVDLPVSYSSKNYSSGSLGQNTYYSVQNNGFDPVFTFYNAGGAEAKIDLSRYGLVNDGATRTQKLLIAGASNADPSIKGAGKDGGADLDSLTLAKNIAMDIERLSISKGAEALGDLGKNPAFLAHQSNLIKQMGSKLFKKMLKGLPMVSGMIAFNEGVSGKDFVSGRNMTGIERGLAFLESAPVPGAKAEAIAAKLNWTKIASAINSYGNTVRGSLYWEGAGFGLEAYKQVMGNTGDYLSSVWNGKASNTEAQNALVFINGSGAAIDKMVVKLGI